VHAGSAIINNAWLLRRDKLNRLLIENNTYEWFLNSIAGVENMMITGLNDISQIDEFNDYKKYDINDKHNALIRMDNDVLYREGISSVDVQKIGK